MLVVYILTVFLSATLLFVVQPMVGKMLLPSMGGSPAVWNTCMVFFQAALLAGYGYVHLTSRYLGPRRQSIFHLALQLTAVLALPIAFDVANLSEHWLNPTVPLLLALLFSVGLPFFVISASAPIFQSWFGWTDHEDAADPYHLYAASNAGSLLALLAYPSIVEPNFDLAEQSALWTAGYGGLIACTVVCAIFLWRRFQPPESAEAPVEAQLEKLPLNRRLYWILCAFIPSSMMLGVTTTVTTDIAAVPMLWVIPLALYLLTFVFVFARHQVIQHRWMLRAFPVALVALLPILILQLNTPMWLVASLHLCVFFVVAMVFHGELNRTRPGVRHLTEFYLWMSVGGVLGGAFNGIVAPSVFPDLYEYPIVVALSALVFSLAVLERAGKRNFPRWSDAIVVTLVLLALMWVQRDFFPSEEQRTLAVAVVVMSVVPFAALYLRPRLFGWGVTVAIVMGYVATAYHYPVLFMDRGYFSASKVVRMGEGKTRVLLHGNTSHGAQSDLQKYQSWSLPYHHPGSPAAEVFRDVQHRFEKGEADTAVIGLGVGGMACVAREGQNVDFFEIDPVVREIATNPALFSFLRDCPGTYDIIMGDGRLRMREQPAHEYALIFIDAFNSDSIPVHIVTREAVEEFLTKLRERGLLAFHISNRYLDLEPMLANMAEQLGIHALVKDHSPPAHDEVALSRTKMVVMARHPEDLTGLRSQGWRAARQKESVSVWTDAFSNLIEIYEGD